MRTGEVEGEGGGGARTAALFSDNVLLTNQTSVTFSIIYMHVQAMRVRIVCVCVCV